MKLNKRLAIAVFASALLVACQESIEAPESRSNCGLQSEQIGTFIVIPSGQFEKGKAALYPEESPHLTLHVDRFSIQVHEVTNREFSNFVDATGYVTEAEQRYLSGKRDAGSAFFAFSNSDPANSNGWTLIADASWRKPTGEGSSIDGKENHPVIHVTRNDAQAYAEWAGGRLPSEVEWEYAASLGLPDPSNPISGAYEEGRPRANTWQGIFPLTNSVKDGFEGIAPVGCFDADQLGAYDMIGNVWEWTDTPFGEETHTLKGGSYLCSDNFCRRYRPAARHPQETDFSSNHIGFRIVKDAPSVE